MASGCGRQRIRREAEENGRAEVNEHEKSRLCFCTYFSCALCLLKPEAKLPRDRSMP